MKPQETGICKVGKSESFLRYQWHKTFHSQFQQARRIQHTLAWWWFVALAHRLVDWSKQVVFSTTVRPAADTTGVVVVCNLRTPSSLLRGRAGRGGSSRHTHVGSNCECMDDSSSRPFTSSYQTLGFALELHSSKTNRFNQLCHQHSLTQFSDSWRGPKITFFSHFHPWQLPSQQRQRFLHLCSSHNA